MFREVQKFRQWWVWLLISPAVVLPWVAFCDQIVFRRPFGNNPGPDWMIWCMLVLFGVGFPLLFAKIRLTVVVTTEELCVRYFPFYSGRIPLSDIASASILHYSGVGYFGGWGIRWSPGRGICFTMGGNQGVQLVLANGRQRLIGSQRAEELLTAILTIRRDLKQNV